MEVSEQVRFDVSESLVCFDVFHMSDDVSATLHPSEDRVSDSISHSSATYQSQHHIPLVPSAAPYFPPLPTLHTNARRHMYFHSPQCNTHPEPTRPRTLHTPLYSLASRSKGHFQGSVNPDPIRFRYPHPLLVRVIHCVAVSSIEITPSGKTGLINSTVSTSKNSLSGSNSHIP
jgi:hypothetical protein